LGSGPHYRRPPSSRYIRSVCGASGASKCTANVPIAPRPRSDARLPTANRREMRFPIRMDQTVEQQRPRRRSQLLEDGWSRRGIDAALRRGELRKEARGLFIERPRNVPDQKDVGAFDNAVTPETLVRTLQEAEALEAEQVWRAKLAVRLAQAGESAAVGVRSAARLHGFDGFDKAREIDLIAFDRHHPRGSKVFRSRTLVQDDIVYVDGLAVTSIARTLVDLGRVESVDTVECAFESAARGPDRKRPREYNEALMAELYERAFPVHQRTGTAVLADGLRRRPIGAIPTGSIVETRAVQVLRRDSVRDVARQTQVRFIGAGGKVVHCFFIDLDIQNGTLFLETNGAIAHGGGVMTKRDVERNNLISLHFELLVVPATDVLYRPGAFVREVQQRLARPARPLDLNRVTRTSEGYDVLL
jgi:hypothetical protein